MCQNRTSIWKVMTIGISRELPMFKFELLDVLCAWIGLSCEKLWTFEFLETLRCSMNRTLDILCAWIGLLCDMLWPFEFLESFRFSIQSISISDAPESDFRVKSSDNWNFSRASDVQFPASRYIMLLNRMSVWQVMTIWISRDHTVFNFERLDILCAWIGRPCDKLWPF